MARLVVLPVLRGGWAERLSEMESAYTLHGYDTFEGGPDAWYDLPDEYPDIDSALAAARERLAGLNKTQSGAGGQSGIQDQVWFRDPTGAMYRVTQ